MENENHKEDEEVITLKDILNIKELETKLILKQQLKQINRQKYQDKLEKHIEELNILLK